MNLFTYLYLTNPKRLIERFRMQQKGAEQARIARRMVAENPRPVYKIPELKEKI